MSITLDGYTAIDLYRSVGFILNNDGSFDLTGLEDPSGGGIQTLYEGIEFLAPVGLEFNLGNVRQVPVVAQGQVQTTFQLPSIDAKVATLRAAYEKFSVDAALTDTKVDTVGAAKFMGIDNDKSGQERLMGFITSQLQAHNEDGNSMWASVLLHRTRIRPNRVNFTDAALAKLYTMSLSRSTKRLWGESYTQNTHGRNEDIGDVILSEYKYGVGIWVGNGEYTEFNLPSDKPAKTSSRAKVFDFTTGAARAGSWDAADDSAVFTPSVPPSDGTVLVVSYEYE